MYVIIGIVVVLILGVGGYFALNGNSANNSSSGSNSNGNNNNPVPAGTVVISQETFKPGTITVNKGETVTWQNNDSIDHTVVADDGSFDLGTIAGGAKVQRTFDTVGTFKYHCSIHTFMKGMVIVK